MDHAEGLGGDAAGRAQGIVRREEVGHQPSSAAAFTTPRSPGHDLLMVGWRPLVALEYTSRPSATTSNRPPPDGIISMSTPWNRFLSVAAKLTALGS